MQKKVIILFFSLLSGIAMYTAMPSVANVFSGMSEDDIIKQVQEAEKFLQDLQQFGTPEEQAQFNKILEETLNSMSEQDFQDIQNIAKMVEPHLQTPETPAPVAAPIAPEAPAEVSTPKSSDAIENFKTMVTSIISRIDEILQKLDSSKACKEEVDTRWINRATLNSLKRQIAQLKINRLAEKLSKKDLNDDEKVLVQDLENFLKEITQKNNSLTIEDTFGLPESKSQEEKYLKQAKDVLSVFDNYIELLLPKLEKFLTKWDPEALQLAKEAEAKASKAQKDAQDALARKPSQNALPPQKGAAPGQGGSSYPGASQGYYPDYNYSDYGYPSGNYGARSGYAGPNSPSSSSAGKAATPGSTPSGTPTPKSSPAQQVNQNLKDQHSNIIEDFKEAIDSYFEKYNNAQKESNISYIQNNIKKGYQYLNPELNKIFTGTNAQNIKSNSSVTQTPVSEKESQTGIEGFNAWHDGVVIPYISKVFNDLGTEQKQFVHELKSAPRLCEDIHSALHDMKPDEVKKASPFLDKLEDRFSSYKESFEAAMNDIENFYHSNMKYLNDKNNGLIDATDIRQPQTKYQNTHQEFIAKLRSEIGDKINEVLSHVDDLKAKVRHKSKRKSKSSSLSQAVQAPQPPAESSTPVAV